MLLKNCIYFIGILFFLFSIPTLIYTIKNKVKKNCKSIVLVDIICIVYLVMAFYLPNILYLEFGLEMLFIYLFEFLAGILYIISIIINLTKIKKLQENPEIQSKQKKVKIAIVAVLILPALLLSTNILRYIYLFNNSELILVYSSAGNGGIGDYETFAYAIGENSCVQFDLGIDIDGYRLKEFLPDNATEIKNIEELKDYKIEFNTDFPDNSISVYKNNELICTANNKSNYFNIDFERGFYINHN
ncbi:MAG: hypothetical protein UE295_09875 [Acutalibacteraceae bacterium]|nr:hypothetical protein [Acutalibacteraceae bacterium]